MSKRPSKTYSTGVFDMVGVLFVVGWLALVVSFVSTKVISSKPTAKSGHVSKRVTIPTGEDWRLISRAEKDVGYVKETRTLLKEGWLIEMDVRNTIQLGKKCEAKTDLQCQLFKYDLKARLDTDGRLKTVFIQSANLTHNKARDQVDFEDITHRAEVDGQTIKFFDPKGKVAKTLKADKDFTLEEFAHYHLANKTDWKKDDAITLHVLNFATKSIEPIKYTFSETMKLENIGIKSDALIFIKEQGFRRYAVAVTPEGRLFTNRMSLNTLATITPKQLALAKSSTIRREAQVISDDVGAEPGRLLKIDWPSSQQGTDYNLMRYLVYAQQAFSEDNTSVALQAWRLPESAPKDLNLTSNRQRLLDLSALSGVKDTSARIVATANWANIATQDYDPNAKPDTAPMLAATDSVDHKDEAIQALLPDRLEDFDATAVKIFIKIDETIKHKPGHPIPQKASANAKDRFASAGGLTLIAAAALRAAKMPARFAYGVRFDKDKKPTPYIWLQAYNGKTFVEYDLTKEDYVVGPRVLQLKTSPNWHPEWLKAFGEFSGEIAFFKTKER